LYKQIQSQLKYSFIPILLLALAFSTWITSCSEEKQKFMPADYFTKSQELSLLNQIVQKTIQKPKAISSESEINAYYETQTKTHLWHFVHERNGGFYYFISKPAPSLYGKRTGLAGFFKTTDHLNISGFKEIFQTTKMKEQDLVDSGGILFTKMVNGENLNSFHSKPGQKEALIELPNDTHYYDSASQSWEE